jgi:nitrogen fixation NifU-like protein
MSAPAIYPEAVLDHYRRPRHRDALAACTHAADGANPLCGDTLRIELRCRDGRIEALGFSGEACAIATATASMLGGLVAGRGTGEVAALAARFEQLVATGAHDAALGELNALGALHRHPGRRKCALLPWAALQAALDGTPATTTETENA